MVGNITSRRPTRRHAAAIAVVLIGIGAITASVVLQGQPSRPPASPSGPPASPPGPPTSQWAPLDLSPLKAAATLVPSVRDNAGIPSDTAFTLSSLTGEPARALAERLEISPPTGFTVVASGDVATATIQPTTALAAGDTYRFTLRTPDGALAASWAFRVRGPVTVTSTIPGDATVGVPVRTGIEVTFDQEGVADMADHFSIEPAADGRFERHGRTQVFVPSELAPATTYTATVRKGLGRTGTDLTLPADVVFRFETEGPGVQETRVVFGRDVIESGPAEQPVIATRAIVPSLGDGPAPSPTSTKVRVYRLPSLNAASRALADFLAAPRWTEYSDPLMPTEGLPVVAAFTAKLEPLIGELLLLRFPAPLDAGWYVVEIQGTRPAHAFLQITPVSAWVSVLSDRTVVWVNDVATHRALGGATVAVGTGGAFARSDADGLAIGPTQKELAPPALAGDYTPPQYPILRVTSGSGDVVLVPFDVRGDSAAYRGEWSEKTESADETYWAMLFTDRGLYRRTDRIEAWGYLRGRDDGKVPSSVQVHLVASGAGRDADVPAIASVEARPGTDGAFTASLPIAGLPLDSYEVQAVVDGRVVVSRWVEVSIIRKPPYQLELTAGHAAVIAGSTVTWTAAATFFDGTPVASLDVVMSGDLIDKDRPATTNAAGQVSLALDARAGPRPGDVPWEDEDWWSIHVGPVGPESAEIWADKAVLVFPSAYALDAAGVVVGNRLRVTGSLDEVDLAKVERQLADDSWDGDASGAPVGGRTLTVTITELIPVRHQVGSTYDFIEKVVRPQYEYDTARKQVQTLSVKSGTDGRIAFSIAVPNADHEYEVVLSTRDGAGRVQQRTIWAGRPAVSWWENAGIAFRTEDGKPAGEAPYGIGDPVVWQMIDDGQPLVSGKDDRYLYLVAQRGLRSAVVTDASTFRHTFGPADAPGVFVIGVRFTGTTYAPKAAAWANFDQAERAIRVQVKADRERYRPGETATLSVRTTLPDGSPVAATVVLQAVDEKLYAIGGASVPRPLDDLYGRVDSGIIRLTATHQVPTMSGPEGEGGDTTGGGGGSDFTGGGTRSDFKDTLLFRELRTDATGRATATVRMSDDLTSWHVTASAVTNDLEAGAGELLVPVGLPFFVELTVADSYLVSDQPKIQVRAFGDALRAGDPVEFSVTSPSLGLVQTKVHGMAYVPVSVELPALALGTQSITVAATATTRTDDAGQPLTDGLTRTFEVVASRLTATETAYGVVAEGLPPVPDGAEQSTWTFTDAGRGRLVPVLSALADPAGVRLDRSIAQSIARETLVAAFGRDPATLPPAEFDLSRYPIGTVQDDNGVTVQAGVGLLPYGSVDPWLAARVALTAPDTFDSITLRDTLVAIRDLPTTKRDLQIATLAGLGAVGEPVLGDLQEARRQADLTPTELIYLALGFEAVGDDASALAIERDLLERYGERLGPWVRLRLDSTAGGADPTALLAVVAAGLGDPLAAGMADYAQSNPAADTVNALELAAYATRSLERTPAAAASFAYTVDGHRSVVLLEPGNAFTLPLTAAQAASLSVETLSGRVGTAVEARVPVAPGSLRPHADLTLTSEMANQPIPADKIVVVDLTAKFAGGAPAGCYDVVERVPSGLAPLSIGQGEADERGITWPSSVVGQEVRFCAGNDGKTGHTAQLRYLARVVNEGTFTWEPAIMQLPGAPEMLAITPAGTATIGTR